MLKTKSFVKAYGQIAYMLRFDLLDWEKLFWFLKVLIPKLLVRDPNLDTLDALLDSADLSTYGLACKTLNEPIELDDADIELDGAALHVRGTRQ